MKQGAFWNSVKDGIQMYNRLNLLLEDNIHQNINYRQTTVSHPPIEVHEDIYRPLFELQDYDLLLFDYSIIQLSIDANGDTRMLYVQNPRKYDSFESYLSSVQIPYTNGSIARLRYEFREEYEQFLSEQEPMANPSYFRYETDPKNRQNNENIHAYAHLHIGLNNNIRIPFGIDLTPYAFLIFVIRQVYYDKWVDVIRKKLLSEKELKYKAKCGPLPLNMWTDKEKQCLHIT